MLLLHLLLLSEPPPFLELNFLLNLGLMMALMLRVMFQLFYWLVVVLLLEGFELIHFLGLIGELMWLAMWYLSLAQLV